MRKRIRQYAGIAAALAAYYLIHEGAHLICALAMGAFRQINVMALGIQIDIYREALTDARLGIFCLLGPAATMASGYGLTLLTPVFCRAGSKVFKAVMYYVTIIMLLLDPLYLSVLCGFFGGGDMNGISLLCPEPLARGVAGLLLALNGLLFWKRILPQYQKAFR